MVTLRDLTRAGKLLELSCYACHLHSYLDPTAIPLPDHTPAGCDVTHIQNHWAYLHQSSAHGAGSGSGISNVETKPMAYHSRPKGSPIPDEYLCVLTRGYYVPSSGDTRPKLREIDHPGDTFEGTYPRYPFSTLVWIAIKLAKWFRRD